MSLFAQAIGTTDNATAQVEARRSSLALAERDLRNTTVRAPHDGRVAGLSVKSGEYVTVAQSLFTLIVTEVMFQIPDPASSECEVFNEVTGKWQHVFSTTSTPFTKAMARRIWRSVRGPSSKVARCDHGRMPAKGWKSVSRVQGLASR